MRREGQSLEDDFQRELNLPRRSDDGRDLARKPGRRSSGVLVERSSGQSQIRVIQDVEELGAELSIDALRDLGFFRH